MTLFTAQAGQGLKLISDVTKDTHGTTAKINS